ncbi:MAG: MATE family efflux transporter [Geobacteraceae bacterium]|nr:MATE family efflux transporter [Geobacteraceae bacterium]
MRTDLTTAPVAVLIRRLAIPAGTGFFFNTMFNVVDTWYGGRLSTTALAAMSLCFPVFFIILAIGSGVSTGATALIGNALGRGEHDKTRRYVLQALSFALLSACVLTVLGLAFAPHIFRFMGAEGDYLSLALSYMHVIFCGTTFFLLNFVMSAILNSHGNTVCYRNFLVSAFVLNLLLDPWFMYGGFGIPAMGLPGIALATILIQCLGNFYMFSRLATLGVISNFRLSELLPRSQQYRELARQGFPSALNMLTVSMGIFIITWFAGRFGKDVVAAYGIGTRIEQIALLPIMGLNISTLALSAQNFGAERFDRIRQVLSLSLRYGFILAAIGTTAALTFTRELMSVFSRDPAVIASGVSFLRIEALVFPAYVLLYVCVSAMQGIKKPVFALWIGLYRQIAAPWLTFHVLAIVLGLGVMGIWWGIFATTWSAAIIVVVYVTWILKQLEKDTTIV